MKLRWLITIVGLEDKGRRPVVAVRDLMTSDVIQVQMTISGRAAADELAVNGVESRLAASSRVSGSVTSRYWAEDDVECLEEWMITFITTSALVTRLIEHLCRIRPYADRCEILAVPVIAAPREYMHWVGTEAW